MSTHDQKQRTAQQGKYVKDVDLNSLAYSGLGEFARQWLLILRNAEFDLSKGRNDLTLTVGGSAGQTGKWRFTIYEGTMRDDFTGRKWSVSCSDHGSRHAKAAAHLQIDSREPTINDW